MEKQKRYVYNFKDAYGLGKELLGGKGYGLAEMKHIGVPIPDGFTITTEACTLYYENNKKIPDFLREEILKNISRIEEETGKKFGENNPLLVSVRSGARISMPGMMDTILNLGLNDKTVNILARETNNERFAYDCYRRFILMFTNIAKGHPRTEMDKMLDNIKKENNYRLDTEIPCDKLKKLVVEYKQYYKSVFKEDFPNDPKEQLIEAVSAVFRSWDNQRANIYRKINGIPYSWGTAVNVQMMVFGNKGETSGTGVAFSRSPSTGENKIFAEYLPNAQGEDVVAGIRTPINIEELQKKMPLVYNEFLKIIKKMELHNKDMQDMEFTIEDGKLYFLQTRNGKRTAAASLKIAYDLVQEKIINKQEALMRIDAKSLDTLLHQNFDPEELKKNSPIATGLPASPGAGTGKIAFTAEEAEKRHKNGEKVILCRVETSPEDIVGMINSEAILTSRGGMTSHAAVVARGMGKCCIAGCNEIIIDEKERTLTLKKNNLVLGENDIISLDGTTGNIYKGDIKKNNPELSDIFETIMCWSDYYRQLKIRTNADTPNDALQAKKFGAEGIGLCRTEHMFFADDRIFYMRKMILSENEKDRIEALKELEPFQEEDFYKLYKNMDGFNINIRLLDPPLHEFLPKEENKIEELAKEFEVSVEHIKNRIKSLHEFNPMMGHRGCRLGVSYPEITKMQVTAIINAALKAQRESSNKNGIVVEIMVPLIFSVKEFKYIKSLIIETADKIIKNSGQNLHYKIGTMIEIPRAAITADEIAKEADFFSFGTNDLTQMTFGFSRDDSGKFLNYYYDKKILEQDPFVSIDQDGVGKLVEFAAIQGKKNNPKLHVGVCGEHGGDPASIYFFHNANLDYVSCSPFRVPTARLAAAQAAIKKPNRSKK